MLYCSYVQANADLILDAALKLSTLRNRNPYIISYYATHFAAFTGFSFRFLYLFSHVESPALRSTAALAPGRPSAGGNAAGGQAGSRSGAGRVYACLGTRRAWLAAPSHLCNLSHGTLAATLFRQSLGRALSLKQFLFGTDFPLYFSF